MVAGMMLTPGFQAELIAAAEPVVNRNAGLAPIATSVLFPLVFGSFN